MDDSDKIQLRSEEINEIFGVAPKWLIRCGISMILVIILIIFIGSIFFKYPDIIEARAIITRENPPIRVISKISGKLGEIFFLNGAHIGKNDTIAVLENAAKYRDVLYLSQFVTTPKPVNHCLSLSMNKFKNGCLILGDIQEPYEKFNRSLNEYRNFNKHEYFSTKLKSIRDELEHQRHYSELLKSQYVLYSETLHLVQNQFVRDSQSYISGALQIWEYEKSKLLYIDKKQKILSLQLELLTLLKTIDHIELSGIEANLNFDKEQNRLQQKLHKSQDDLLIALERWKETYLLIATSAGTLNYMRDWSRENLIKNLECIFTITPIDPGGYKAKIVIPAIGIEKVKLGQQVNIKLEGYPSTEYGLLQGIVGTISNIPTEKGYPAIVNLPSEVITSCGFKINSERELSGTAEIVIENKSVFDRLINPFKSLLKNKMDK